MASNIQSSFLVRLLKVSKSAGALRIKNAMPLFGHSKNSSIYCKTAILFLENSGKIRRWKLLVQEYNCGLEHISGADNFVADDFSSLIPHIRENEGDEVLSHWDVSSSADVGPSHLMMADPVEEVTDDAFATPQSLPQLLLLQLPSLRNLFITKLISNVHNSFVGHMGVDKNYA